MIDELFREKLAQHTSPVSSGTFDGVMSKRKAGAGRTLFGGKALWLLVVGVLFIGGGAFLSGDQAIASKAGTQVQRDGVFASSTIEDKSTSLQQENQTSALSGSIEEGRAIGLTDQKGGASSGKSSSDEVNATEPNSIDSGSGQKIGHEREGASENDISKTAGQKSSASKANINVAESMAGNVNTGNKSDSKRPAENPTSQAKPEGNTNTDKTGNTDKGLASGAATSKKILGSNAGESTRSANNSSDQKNAIDKSTDPYGIDPSSTIIKSTLLDVAIRPTTLKAFSMATTPNTKGDPEQLHGPKKMRWFQDATSGYARFNGSWVAGADESDLRTTSETFDRGLFDLGLRAGIQLKQDWVFTAGVLYSAVGSTVNTSIDQLTTTTYVDTSGGYWDLDSNMQNWVSVYDTTTVVTSEQRARSHKNKYQILRIPLSAGYKIQKGRFGFGLNAGVSFDFVISKNGQYPFSAAANDSLDNPTISIRTGKSSLRTGISFFGSLSLSYALTERLHLLVEPSYQSGTLPFSNGGSPYYRAHLFGVRGGLRYYFR